MRREDDGILPLGGTLTVDFGEDEDVVIIDLETDEVSDIPVVSTWPN